MSKKKKHKAFIATFSVKGDFRFFCDNKVLAWDHARSLADWHPEEFGRPIAVKFIGYTETDTLEALNAFSTPLPSGRGSATSVEPRDAPR